jgi:tetratricopeptide (TPR) repeat protein
MQLDMTPNPVVDLRWLLATNIAILVLYAILACWTYFTPGVRPVALEPLRAELAETSQREAWQDLGNRCVDIIDERFQAERPLRWLITAFCLLMAASLLISLIPIVRLDGRRWNFWIHLVLAGICFLLVYKVQSGDTAREDIPLLRDRVCGVEQPADWQKIGSALIRMIELRERCHQGLRKSVLLLGVGFALPVLIDTRRIWRLSRSVKALETIDDFDDADRSPSGGKKHERFSARRQAALEAYRKGNRLRKTEKDKAIEFYTQAIELDSAIESAYCNRALTYCETVQDELAVADLKTLQTRNSALADRLTTLFEAWAAGLVQLAQEKVKGGDFKTAVFQCTQSLIYNPTDPHPHVIRAQAHRLLGQHDQAMTDLARALELDAGCIAAYGEQALVHEAAGRYEDSIRAVKQLLKLDPQHPDGLNHLAWIHATCPVAGLRNGELALKLATRACKLSDGEHWAHLDTLAAAYAQQGDFERAGKWLAKAIKKAPDEERGELRSRLKLYESGKPFRLESRALRPGKGQAR